MECAHVSFGLQEIYPCHVMCSSRIYTKFYFLCSIIVKLMETVPIPELELHILPEALCLHYVTLFYLECFCFLIQKTCMLSPILQRRNFNVNQFFLFYSLKNTNFFMFYAGFMLIAI